MSQSPSLSVFDYKNHHEYLEYRLRTGTQKWGKKTRLAEHLRVQPAFISQVISEKLYLSLEQADLANQFFEHDPQESDFFLIMVSKDRAGTKSLKEYYEKQIQAILDKRKLIQNRLSNRPQLPEAAQTQYYSSWIYSAIHVACTVTDLQNKPALCKHFHLPEHQVDTALFFLQEHGLIIKEGLSYKATQNWVRLTKDSPLIVRHHTNWRMQAIQNVEFQKKEDLHFSGIYSLDKDTAEKIKNHMMDFIKQQIQLIETAPEKTLYILGIDFFEK